MICACIVQGRRIEPSDVAQIREPIRFHPEWSRYRLPNELCSLSYWRAPLGQHQDTAARTLPRKLHERGWVHLPDPRVVSPNRHRLTPPS